MYMYHFFPFAICSLNIELWFLLSLNICENLLISSTLCLAAKSDTNMILIILFHMFLELKNNKK